MSAMQTLPLRAVRGGLSASARVSPALAARGAFVLFRRTGQRSRVRSVERATHETAAVTTLETRGKRVVTYRWGDGPRPVLLVHGWQSRASRFSRMVDGLVDRGHSVVAFDAPGHGESTGSRTTILEYRDIIAQLHEANGPFTAVVAHSFGVPCAVHALRTGVSTSALVAISGVCDLGFLPDDFCRQLGLGSAVAQRLRDRADRLLLAPETDIWQRFSATWEAEKVTVPMLVVHDQDDEVVPHDHARALVRAYPDQATLTTTARLGHRRILTDRAVIGEVLDFVDLHAPALLRPATGAEDCRV